MHTAGIIAEYNPFHKGHAYQIQTLRDTYRPDYVIIAMSGNFLQRGAPALTDKYTRAKMALSQGADLVLELPACFATASAEFFALGAALLFHTTGLADSLCFGVESPDFERIFALARLLAQEPKAYRDALLFYLKQGDSFPVARTKALPEYADLLGSPNNILGIEYCKALLTLKSSITPVPILRKGSGYHDTDIDDAYASASAIRGALRQSEDSASWHQHTAVSPFRLPQNISQALPEKSCQLMEDYLATAPFLWEDDFSLLLHHRLLQENSDTLLRYADMTENLAKRISSKKKEFRSWSSFCEILNTKDLTYARASRVLTHILLGIRQEQLAPFLPVGTPEQTVPSSIGQRNMLTSRSSYSAKKAQIDASSLTERATVLPYLRVLGFSKGAAPLLSKLNAAAKAPVLTSLASAGDLLDSQGLTMLQTDLFAADLYRSVCTFRTGRAYPNEYGRRLLVC